MAKFIENADRVGQLLTGGNGSLYLVGDTRTSVDGNVHQGEWYIFDKFDEYGNKFWTKQYGGSGDEYVKGIEFTGHENYDGTNGKTARYENYEIFITGETNNDLYDETYNGGKDAFLIKITDTGITDENNYSIYKNYTKDSSAPVLYLNSWDVSTEDSYTYQLVDDPYGGTSDDNNDLFTIEGNKLQMNGFRSTGGTVKSDHRILIRPLIKMVKVLQKR